MAIALHMAPLPRGSDFGEQASSEGPSFGALLRRHRFAVGLSQEAISERANLSVSAIRAVEHGERQAPYRATVGALATALDLTGPERVALEATVSRSRGQRGAAAPGSFALSEPEAYRRDVPNAQVQVLDTGHFALDTPADEIAALIRGFIGSSR